MTVFRHRIDIVGQPPAPPKAAAWTVTRLAPDDDIDCLRPLLQAGNADSRASPRPSLAGLLGELATREGRSGVGFVARSRLAGPATAVTGLAVVIEATGLRGRGFSLAWLLVHPAVRRQGVATALLTHAFAHVRSSGGTELSAETLASWPDAVAFWRSMTAKP